MSLASDCVLSLGSAALNLVSTGTRGFHLGGSTTAGGLFVELAAPEAKRITTTGKWTIQSPAITILAILKTDTNAPVELNARVSSGQIAFSGTSSFYSLNATAAAGITIAADVTTTIGQLNLDGNYDMAGQDTDPLAARNFAHLGFEPLASHQSFWLRGCFRVRILVCCRRYSTWQCCSPFWHRIHLYRFCRQ